jgi:hypothetical protein
MLDFPLHRLPIKISNFNAGGGDHRQIAIVKKEDIARVGQKRRYI